MTEILERMMEKGEYYGLLQYNIRRDWMSQANLESPRERSFLGSVHRSHTIALGGTTAHCPLFLLPCRPLSF